MELLISTVLVIFLLTVTFSTVRVPLLLIATVSPRIEEVGLKDQSDALAVPLANDTEYAGIVLTVHPDGMALTPRASSLKTLFAGA